MFNIADRNLGRSGGGHRIATHLRNNDWDCEVVDFFLEWELCELQEFIRSRMSPDMKFIGLSIIFNTPDLYDKVYGFCSWVKEEYPDLFIISGSQSELLDYRCIDYHIIGHGEKAMDAVLSTLFGTGEFLVYQKINSTRIIYATHNYPSYPFLDPIIKYEKRDFIIPDEWGKIEFSRGCRFNCLMCSEPLRGIKEDYTRTQDSVREQMQHAYDNFGIKNYSVSDETFNDTSKKITKFADVMDSLDFDPYFCGYIRADLLITRPNDKEELARMGFFGQFYGIETFNQQSANAIGKGFDVNRLKQGLVDIKNYYKQNHPKKYRGSISLVAGLPHETEETFDECVKWLRKHWMRHCADASPLEINKTVGVRKARIDEIWKDYNYREMEGVCEELRYFVNIADGQMLWSNEHTNVIEAQKWCDKVHDVWRFGGLDRTLQPLDIFEMAGIMIAPNGKSLDVKHRLSLMDVNRKEFTENTINNFISGYIDNKLNL
jgi:hypothetical protein